MKIKKKEWKGSEPNVQHTVLQQTVLQSNVLKHNILKHTILQHSILKPLLCLYLLIKKSFLSKNER